MADAATAIGYSQTEVDAIKASFADVGVSCTGEDPPDPPGGGGGGCGQIQLGGGLNGLQSSTLMLGVLGVLSCAGLRRRRRPDDDR